MSALTKPFLLTFLFAAVVCSSCSKDSENSTSNTGADASSGLSTFWKGMATNASSAQPVITVRKQAKEGAAVSVTGRIKDFSPKLAVFTLTDSSIKSCAETEDDQCPTPWDYCCIEAEVVAKSTVTIEFHDPNGRPFREGLKGFQDLKNLDHLVINGTAHRDDAGNVTVIASSFGRP